MITTTVRKEGRINKTLSSSPLVDFLFSPSCQSVCVHFEHLFLFDLLNREPGRAGAVSRVHLDVVHAAAAEHRISLEGGDI